jgi:hypothetical protein
MRKIISMVAALILGAALAIPISASAASGKAFMHNVKNPEELAQMIEASLAKDQSGKSMLNPAKCDSDGSCGSTLSFLQALQQHPAGKHLTSVDQIPGYLRTLVERTAPAGEYWISCLRSSSNVKVASKGTYRVEMHCLSREFKPGFKVWVDPKANNLIVFDQFCTNPVEKPVSPKQACVYIHFFTKVGDVGVRFAELGPANIEDDCIGVKKAGESNFESVWAEDCFVAECDFSSDAEVVGQPVRFVGSYVPNPGEHVLRLPAFVAEKGSLFVTVLCLDRTAMAYPEIAKGAATYAQGVEYAEHRQEWISNHSDGVGVRWFDFQRTRSETKIATVYYTKAEAPKSGSQNYWTWGEWDLMQQELQHKPR